MDANAKLKDPGTCRIFFSSPFGGMEEEREELTKKYFPQIHHACNAKGIKFVPVDMRWGITKEAADNAQVMNICLREVSRSDFFVGFFGQRYGWHSAHLSDSTLLENFDKAMGTYPWINKYRDRSMTEIECRAGHLNNPGALPACFCFRDKEYDDYKRDEALKEGKKSEAVKYTVENEFADNTLKAFVKEVIDSEDKTWGVQLNCKNPQAMAKFMYESVWKFLNEVVLKEVNEEEVPFLVENRLVHDKFISSASHIYCGCENYQEELMSKLDSPRKGTVVSGPAGCGKSALLANWLLSVRKTRPHVAMIYHFIGCAPGTEKPRTILERILLELRDSFPTLYSKTPAPDDNDKTDLNQDGSVGADAGANGNQNNVSSSDNSKNEVQPLKDDVKEQPGDVKELDDIKEKLPINKVVDENKNEKVSNGSNIDKNSNSRDDKIKEESKSLNDDVKDVTQEGAKDEDIMAFNLCTIGKHDKVLLNNELEINSEKVVSSGNSAEDGLEKLKKDTCEDQNIKTDQANGELKTTSTENKTSEKDTNSSQNDSLEKENKEGKSKSGLEKKTTHQLINEITVLMNQITEQGHKVIIILDALNQQKSMDKTFKHLYWLPENFPSGITFICSTLDSDTASHDLLVKERGMDLLMINPYEVELQQNICVATLKVAGKELSPTQLERVVNARETSNALFLKLVLYELSIYGSFHKLDAKIDSLILVSGVKLLLQIILERLESDYTSEDYNGNLVKDVLCCLIASRKGLSESELQEILNVPTHLWSPLFFALEHLLSHYTGLLGFAFAEMREAVIDRYLSNSAELVRYKKKLVNYFDSIRKTMKPWLKSSIKPEFIRANEELPWLQVDVGDKEGLITTLSDLSMLRRITDESSNNLLNLWQQTNLPWSAVSALYIKAFDETLAYLYEEMQDGLFDPPFSPGMKIRVLLQCMRCFFDTAYYSKGSQLAMEREIRILETCESSITEEKHAEYLRDARYYLAVSYSDQHKSSKSLALFMIVHEECERLLKEKEDKVVKEMFAFTCNGIGLVYYNTQDYGKAKEFLQKSRQLHSEMKQKLHEAASTTNLGLVLVNQKKYVEALAMFDEAAKLYNEHFFGQVSIEIGNLYTNIALTYRRMKVLDKAEEYYHKSLEMKAMNVGWNHPVIATAFMNLGTLEMHRQAYHKSEEWTRKAIAIYEINEHSVEEKSHRMCRENLCTNLMKQGKKKEIIPLYLEVANILVDNGWIGECLVALHRTMLEYLYDLGGYKKEVEKIVVAILGTEKRRVKFAFILANLDAETPQDKRPVRPKELTLEHFLEEYPKDASLKILNVTTILARKNELEEIIEECLELDRMEKNLKESAYSCAADALSDNKFYQSSLKICEIGLEKYPDTLDLISEVARAFCDLNKPDGLAEHMPKILAGYEVGEIKDLFVVKLLGCLYKSPDHYQIAAETYQKIFEVSKNPIIHQKVRKEFKLQNSNTVPPSKATVADDDVANAD